MKIHHYLEVNKLREEFVQLVKNKGQIRISIWGVGFYSGFWPEYLPLTELLYSCVVKCSIMLPFCVFLLFKRGGLIFIQNISVILVDFEI